ncbi:Flavocytochrome c [Russula emetica]|nr:Flavocytochrome c [Russula emetica]
MAQVIVVGGAHTLLERGANVLLLDKQGFMGGNSTKATSGINGAGTQTQQDHGIADSAKIFFDDTKDSARDLARDDLIRVLTGRSGDAVNWLQNKFALDLSKVSRLGGHSQPRTHRGDAQFPGMVITYAQLERLEDLAQSIPDRVKILKKARVTNLLKDESGTVTGVEYVQGGKTSTALGPVILATGGYAADFTSDSLLKKYRPEFWDLPTTNGEHSTGDGHKLAISAGASAVDMEKVQVHPTGLVDPKEPDAKVKFLAAEALRGVGGLLLDNEGQRFVDELQHRDFFPTRLVLNGKASKEIEWHCKHYVGRGLMKRFDSGEALAKEFGLSPAVLKKSFDGYNLAAKTKKDRFAKKFFSDDNWTLNDTFHIDPEAHVLAPGGAPLPGLFAAGEVAGGVHGANRLGGSSLLNYGNVSARAAGRLAGAKEEVTISSNAASSSPSSSGEKTYTVDEVATHNKKEDIWVVIDGQVLDVTKFLPIIRSFPRYAPDAVIGQVRK